MVVALPSDADFAFIALVYSVSLSMPELMINAVVNWWWNDCMKVLLYGMVLV